MRMQQERDIDVARRRYRLRGNTSRVVTVVISITALICVLVWSIWAILTTKPNYAMVVSARPSPHLLMYFPIVRNQHRTALAESYMMVRDGLGYGPYCIAPSKPLSVPTEWHFATVGFEDDVGIVVRQVKNRSIDNTDIRVFWLSPEELSGASQRHLITLPAFETLPEIGTEILSLRCPTS